YATTTGGIIESIIKANDNGKIKIRKVEDNTAKDVEIVVHLAPGVSPDVTIDALYAFTDCQISISPNCCVIYDNKPHFLGVTELLRINTQQTVNLLKRELEIKLGELEEDWHMSSLEKIFIEKRIYRDIEESKTWEDVMATIHAGLKKYRKLLYRDITDEDVVRLTELRIKRISKYDSFKADEHIKQVEADIAQTKHDLANLRDFAIKYYENLIKKYGKDRERKTEIRSFETIKAQQVALANTKLYVNYEDGFIGTGLKKDEFAFECSDLDDIIVFTAEGKMSVNKVSDKTFVGKGIIYLDVFKKNDEKTVYSMVYRDGRTGPSMVKRFTIGGVTRGKEYNLTRGTDGTKVHYFEVHPNRESEVVNVALNPNAGARKKEFTFDFAELEVKGREAKGNILTKYPVKKVTQKSKTVAAPTASEIFYDPQFGRLNIDGKGNLLGEFHQGDLILAVYNDGNYELTDFALTHRFEPTKTLVIEKFSSDAVLTALYFDGKAHFLKRFKIETNTVDRKFLFIPEHKDAKVLVATTDESAKIKIAEGGKRSATERTINPAKFIDVKGWKANGIKVTDKEVQNVEVITKQIDNTVFVEETEEVKASRRKKSDLVLPELSGGKIDFEWEIKPLAKADTKTNGTVKNGKSQKGLFD
ncbi:MAG TPA: DNA gyrase/topoisomerase IV subunit A, partial [Chitinophagales bacterium]|nr:DNA gyrase/topoisomerase IV subunit A [Chitinophagales bacterium]